MSAVTTKDQIINNIITFEQYLNSKDAKEKKFATDLLSKSTNMVVYKVDGENHFAPSTFMGEQKNSMASYQKNEEKHDVKENDKTVEKVLRVTAFTNSTTEEKFGDYMKQVKVKPTDEKRKYWRLKGKEGKNLDMKLEDILSGNA